MIMKTNLMKNTIWLTIGSVISKGLLFVMLPFFSSWLTPEEFGIYDVLCTYISLLVPILNLATGEGMFRFSIDATEIEKKTYITNGIAIVALNYLIFGTILIVLNRFVAINYLAAFLLLLLGNLLDAYLSSYLRATKQLKIYSFSNAITVIIIAIAVTVFVYILGLGIHGILLGYALGYIVGDSLILIFSKYPQYFSLRTIQKKIGIQLIKYSAPLILNNVSWWFMNVSDRSVISYYLGNASNGIYAIACKIPTLCTAIFSMFNVSWQQTASELIETKKIEAYFNQVYRQMVRILISICSVILAFNFIFFNYFFNRKYYDAHYYVGILVSAAMILSLSQFYGGVQIARKQPQYVGYTTAIGALVNVLLNLAVIKYFGLWAASVTTLIGNAAILLIRQIHIRKYYHITIGKQEYIGILIYLYFAAASHFIENMTVNFINLLLAVLYLVLVNKQYVIKICNYLRRNNNNEAE